MAQFHVTGDAKCQVTCKYMSFNMDRHKSRHTRELQLTSPGKIGNLFKYMSRGKMWRLEVSLSPHVFRQLTSTTGTYVLTLDNYLCPLTIGQGWNNILGTKECSIQIDEIWMRNCNAGLGGMLESSSDRLRQQVQPLPASPVDEAERPSAIWILRQWYLWTSCLRGVLMCQPWATLFMAWRVCSYLVCPQLKSPVAVPPSQLTFNHFHDAAKQPQSIVSAFCYMWLYRISMDIP